MARIDRRPGSRLQPSWWMTALAFAFAAATNAFAQDSMSYQEAMSEEFPDSLFVVTRPVESRERLNPARSGGFRLASMSCLGSTMRSRTGKVWFVYNNRGSIAGKTDAVSVLVVKQKSARQGAAPARRVSFAAFRNSNPWYRGIVSTYFRPKDRPLRRVTLTQWNSAHQSGRTSRYDRLFGRRPGDRFHASPVPDGASSSNDSPWWALPELEAVRYDELAVSARLLRFRRAGYKQSTAGGVSFYLTPGDFDRLLLKVRSKDQTTSRRQEFSLKGCD